MRKSQSETVLTISGLSCSNQNIHIGQFDVPLFPIEVPNDEEELEVTLDVDSFSMLGGNLTKLAFMCVNHEEKNVFEFPLSYDRKIDCTTKSRFSVKTDDEYNPIIVNRERKKFGFHMLKNLRLFKIRKEGFDITFSIHIMDDSHVANPLFTENMIGAICLCLNTAKNHPDWILPYLDSEWTIEDGLGENNFWDLQDYQAYIHGIKAVENFRSNRGGPRAYATIDADTGLDFVSLFHAALCFFSEMTVAEHDMAYPNQNIHEDSFHGMLQANLNTGQLKATLFHACKYIVENAIFSAVTAGTKNRFKSKVMTINYCDTVYQQGRNYDFQIELFQEVDSIKEDLFNQLNWGAPEMVQEQMNNRFPNFDGLMWNGLIYQFDIGVEVSTMDISTCLYTNGPVSYEIIKRSIFNVKKERIAAVRENLFERNMDDPMEEGDEDLEQEQ